MKKHITFIEPTKYITAHSDMVVLHETIVNYCFANQIELLDFITDLKNRLEMKPCMSRAFFDEAFEPDSPLRKFVLKENICLILGDNVYTVPSAIKYLKRYHEFTDSSDSEAGPADSSEDSVQFRPGR